jgi:hypothetical protein
VSRLVEADVILGGRSKGILRIVSTAFSRIDRKHKSLLQEGRVPSCARIVVWLQLDGPSFQVALSRHGAKIGSSELSAQLGCFP